MGIKRLNNSPLLELIKAAPHGSVANFTRNIGFSSKFVYNCLSAGRIPKSAHFRISEKGFDPVTLQPQFNNLNELHQLIVSLFGSADLFAKAIDKSSLTVKAWISRNKISSVGQKHIFDAGYNPDSLKPL